MWIVSRTCECVVSESLFLGTVDSNLSICEIDQRSKYQKKRKEKISNIQSCWVSLCNLYQYTFNLKWKILCNIWNLLRETSIHPHTSNFCCSSIWQRPSDASSSRRVYPFPNKTTTHSKHERMLQVFKFINIDKWKRKSLIGVHICIRIIMSI